VAVVGGVQVGDVRDAQPALRGRGDLDRLLGDHEATVVPEQPAGTEQQHERRDERADDQALTPGAAGPGAPRGDGQRGAHRTVMPSAAIAAFASPIVISWKWNTLAASTASAPAWTAGAKCSGRPAPPEAISGRLVASRARVISSRSKPSLVPSASIEFSRISPAPRSVTSRIHSIASMP